MVLGLLGKIVPLFTVTGTTSADQMPQLTAAAHTLALLPLLTGSARRVVHGEIGCSNWKKTLAYLLVGLDRRPGSFDVEDATTLSWSSAAVSE